MKKLLLDPKRLSPNQIHKIGLKFLKQERKQALRNKRKHKL
ncbi:MAG: hypothetical protein US60_C0022G0004 [Microgenomates group bacterium GW2011_GWC1_37_8]|nr:MAG: hypothetical protein US60_C0022G0004 [Microgenomates group bacterium GW2011_GWC1_37_8]